MEHTQISAALLGFFAGPKRCLTAMPQKCCCMLEITYTLDTCHTATYVAAAC